MLQPFDRGYSLEPFARVACDHAAHQPFATVASDHAAHVGVLTYVLAVINPVRSEPSLFCCVLVQPHPSSLLRMELHIHMFIHETLYVMRQYNPQFYIFEQMYTDSFNDQLSDADTVDYGELPDLIDE